VAPADMIFSLLQMQQKRCEQYRPLHIVFVDLTKIFNVVSKGELCIVLQN